MSRPPKRPLSDFGKRVRELQKASRFKTRTALVEALGVAPMTLYRWEVGDTKPSAADLMKLADLLGTRPEGLFATVGGPIALASEVESEWTTVFRELHESLREPPTAGKAARMHALLEGTRLLSAIRRHAAAAETLAFATSHGSEVQRAVAAELVRLAEERLLETLRPLVLAVNADVGALRSGARDKALGRPGIEP